MKFRISVSPEKREEIERFLEEHGIETDPGAEYTIVQERMYQLEELLAPGRFLESASRL